MKIAIASEKDDLSSEISTQGARTIYFLIYAENGDLIEILENPYANNDSHVGPDVARMLSNNNITKVIAGRFGPKFRGALEENNVECIEETGFISQAIKKHTN